MTFVSPLEETKALVSPINRNKAHERYCVLPSIHKMVCVTPNTFHFPQMFEKQDVCLT